MMSKKIWVTLLLSSLLSFAAVAEESNVEPSEGQIIQFTRGKSVTLNELSSVADLSTARNQKGNPVTLEDVNYTVASFTRTTITIEPPNGSTADVITLDLK
ncbi:hypothetical protein [Legionella shakespearei]|uniref:Uncharacterized protein n=1 Tax=Legionella shakespearei DSM 23087 TaxID=1122169 RepID=A0A0W0YLU8_9GAMM|nr:hypothetical protein [Legionella shakespearei]KTD57815.1 hypothetical protein Lsha_2249 [Legionella shakespearei DSM 23087]